MFDENEEAEIPVENEISLKAQPTEPEANIKQKDKQEKEKEYSDVNGYKNLNF
jgi:hypothetical protein